MMVASASIVYIKVPKKSHKMRQVNLIAFEIVTIKQYMTV